jgi:hypothetical protein
MSEQLPNDQSYEPRLMSAYGAPMIVGLVVVALTVLLGTTFTQAPAAQRLCENSDFAVARISPCTGPSGTVINLTLRRRLTSPPRTLLFKRVLANGVPARVTVTLNGLAATIPPQLCTTGGGKWEVWLTDAAGRSQGVIGAFSPDCRGNSGTNANGSGGGGGGGGNGNSEGGGNSNSGGGGDNANSENNRNSNQPGRGSAAIDPCLVGTWEAMSVTLLGELQGRTTGGEGFRVAFGRDGTERIDYSTMKTIAFYDSTSANPDTYTYRGTASGRISTENKVAKLESIEQSAVTNHQISVGQSFNLKIVGLGPGGLGTTANDNNYTCTENSLEYKTSISIGARRGRPDYSVKLTRRKN